MDSFVCVCLLGLLTLGLATPLTTETPIPQMDEEEYRDLENDGLLVEGHQPSRMVTTSPLSTTIGDRPVMADNSTVTERTPANGEEFTTVKGAEGPSKEIVPSDVVSDLVEAAENIPSDFGEFATGYGSEVYGVHVLDVEGSAIGENPTTTTLGELEESHATLHVELTEVGSGDFPSKFMHSTIPTTTIIIADRTDGPGFGDYTGHWNGGIKEISTTEAPQATTMSGIKEISTTEAPQATTMSEIPAIPGKVVANGTTMAKGHVTPDWVIILGFLVGVAVLVLLCVAVATRDKWNGPSQYNRTGVTLDPVVQPSAVEMEEFLHNEQPKENGKADEYTVIPLEELPHSYTS